MINEIDYEAICAKLGYKFRDPQLLLEALCHPSLRQHSKYKNLPVYERLEFLGDGVLNMVISEALFKRYLADDEGSLAKKRSYLVSAEAICNIANKLEIMPHILLAPAEKKHGITSTSILENVMEALIGAIYLDSDFSTVKEFINKLWAEEFNKKLFNHNTKTMLQEWAQGNGLPIPEYIVINTEGSAHEPTFTVQLSITGYPEFIAQGKTIKAAEKEVARLFLEHIEILLG